MIVCIIPTLIGSLATSVKIDRDGVVVGVIFGVGNGDNCVLLVLLLGMDEEDVVPLLGVITVGDLDDGSNAAPALLVASEPALATEGLFSFIVGEFIECVFFVATALTLKVLIIFCKVGKKVEYIDGSVIKWI